MEKKIVITQEMLDKDLVHFGEVKVKQIQKIRQADDKDAKNNYMYQQIPMLVTYDLEDCSLAKDIIPKSLATYVIRTAQKIRILGESWALEHKESFVVKIKDFFAGRVPAKSKKETVQTWFSRLTAEQRTEFLNNPDEYLTRAE